MEWFVGDTSSVEYVCLGVGLYGCLAMEGKNAFYDILYRTHQPHDYYFNVAISLGVTSTTVERQFSSPFQSVTTDNSNSETAVQTIIRDY